MPNEGGDDMAEATTARMEGPDRSVTVANGPVIAGRLLAFYAAVVVIQGGHVVEHIIQLIQVFVLGVPDDQALGLLGYVFAFQGTEEWLHIVFNVLYLISLVVIGWGLWRSPVARSVVPRFGMMAFVFFGVSLEAWHVVEHVVIISNVVANNGCPCPGILDSRLGVSDTVLHFGYNAIAYSATILPFAYLLRHRWQSAKPH
jgi:hypothetical protein